MGGFVSLGLIIGFFYGGEIKRMMLEQLNQHLATEIKVKEFHFSVLKHFPYASFDMEEVMAREVCDKKEKDTLLYAKIFLSYSISWQCLTKTLQ